MGTQELIYAAVATLIAAFMLLSMFFVQRRGQDASVDAVQYRAARSSMLSLVYLMERDFKNFGSNMRWDAATSSYVGGRIHPNTVNLNTSFDSTAVSGGMRYDLRFISQTDSTQPFANIHYLWEPIAGDSVTLADGTVRQLYELKRYSDGTLTYSDNLLTAFDVEMLSDTALLPVVINPVDIRLFKVSLRGVSPLGMAATIEETSFDATYRPVAMTMYD